MLRFSSLLVLVSLVSWAPTETGADEMGWEVASVTIDETFTYAQRKHVNETYYDKIYLQVIVSEVPECEIGFVEVHIYNNSEDAQEWVFTIGVVESGVYSVTLYNDPFDAGDFGTAPSYLEEFDFNALQGEYDIEARLYTGTGSACDPPVSSDSSVQPVE